MIILEVMTFVVGLIVVIRGAFTFGRSSVDENRARVIGTVLMLPLAVGICAYAYYGSSMLQQQISIEEAVTWVSVVEMLVWTGSLLVASFAIFTASTPKTAHQWKISPLLFDVLPDTLTPTEAAKYLRIPETEVFGLIDKGELQAQDSNGKCRISKDALRAFLETKRSPAH